ncbi:TRAP transporter small permease [Marinobacter changyiensis]|uniref:TRAP transporter small permease n=1 Tax=Marinobacter changyiensis TaxID=2604091 RepID=UPI00126428CF|nr:TRAP transporter small permease [Marinobacter changyiensis]
MTKLAMQSWDGLLAVLRWTMIVVLIFMMLTICYDVVMRYVFVQPTSWSLEINSFLLVYLAVIGAGEAQRHDSHIRITFFTQRLPRRGQDLVRIVTGALGLLFCSIMVWRGSLMAHDAWSYGERVSSAFGTLMVYPYALIPIGFGALGLQFLIDILCAGYDLFRPTNREDTTHA